MTNKIAVIGAGAAGISAAYRLDRAGFDVTVFEAEKHVAGRCRSIVQDGFVFDIGAGIVPSTYSNTLELINDLGLAEDLVPSYTVIGTYRDGQLHRIDSKRPHTFLSASHLSSKSKFTLLKFAVDLLRMSGSMNFYDLSSAARWDTETVAEYCQRRLNPELFEYFIGPLCRSLFLVEPEHSSVVDLMCSAKSVLTATHLAGHPQGIGHFLQVAADRLNVKLGTRVTRVEEADYVIRVVWDHDGEELSSEFDACVISLPAHQLLKVYPQLDDVRRDYLSSIQYSTSIMVQLGLGQRTDEISSMLLIPREVEPSLPVVSLSHNLSPNRAPEGKSALTAYWMSDWSEQHWNKSDSELTQMTVETINRLFPGLANKLETSVVTRWQPALVAATPGVYRGLVDFANASDPSARVQLAGDYLAQTSVNSSVASGERAAENIKKQFLS